MFHLYIFSPESHIYPSIISKPYCGDRGVVYQYRQLILLFCTNFVMVDMGVWQRRICCIWHYHQGVWCRVMLVIMVIISVCQYCQYVGSCITNTVNNVTPIKPMYTIWGLHKLYVWNGWKNWTVCVWNFYVPLFYFWGGEWWVTGWRTEWPRCSGRRQREQG